MSTHEQTMQRFDRLEEMLVRALRDQIALTREVLAKFGNPAAGGMTADEVKDVTDKAVGLEKKLADLAKPQAL